MSFSLYNVKIHSPAIFDKWSPTRIMLVYVHHCQANLQTPTVAAVASAMIDWQLRTRMSQKGATSYNVSEFTKSKTLRMRKQTSQFRRAKRHWSKRESMATPRHFGRLYEKQVKWWQCGKSSWEASLLCDHTHFVFHTKKYWQWLSSFDSSPQHAWGVLCIKREMLVLFTLNDSN